MPDSLEQLDLLLIQVVKARQVRVDGIHFQNLRYISTTLAAYIGETVTLRFDPRDMAEVRVFHNDKFLCRAVCAELAGEAVALRDILRARNTRRRELRGILRDRQAAVETLLELKRGEPPEKRDAPTPEEDKKQPNRPQPSSATETNNRRVGTSAIVETLEHRRFTEFCDACRRYGYIGLCFGSPGVGKTLSARTYSRWDAVLAANLKSTEPVDPTLTTVLYTASVVNSPGSVDSGIRKSRNMLRDLSMRTFRSEMREQFSALINRDAKHREDFVENQDWLNGPLPELAPRFGDVAGEYHARERAFPDPTSLVVVDEADRLRMARP